MLGIALAQPPPLDAPTRRRTVAARASVALDGRYRAWAPCACACRCCPRRDDSPRQRERPPEPAPSQRVPRPYARRSCTRLADGRDWTRTENRTPEAADRDSLYDLQSMNAKSASKRPRSPYVPTISLTCTSRRRRRCIGRSPMCRAKRWTYRGCSRELSSASSTLRRPHAKRHV